MDYKEQEFLELVEDSIKAFKAEICSVDDDSFVFASRQMRQLESLKIKFTTGVSKECQQNISFENYLELHYGIDSIALKKKSIEAKLSLSDLIASARWRK